MILSESELSQRAGDETLPLRDAFSVLFFVSVGMLFDPLSLIENPLPIVATLFIIMIGKSVAAFLIVLAFRHPVATALTISASLAQIGEFSFILAELGVAAWPAAGPGRDLILAGAILSICLNPLTFVATDWLARHLERRRPLEAPSGARDAPAAAPAAELPANGPPTMTALSDHIVLVGYGRVGSLVGQFLKARGQPFLVIEDGRPDGSPRCARPASRRSSAMPRMRTSSGRPIWQAPAVSSSRFRKLSRPARWSSRRAPPIPDWRSSRARIRMPRSSI